MISNCHNDFCLFQHENGCTECRVCAYCGTSIDNAGPNPMWMNASINSLLDTYKTTVPTCMSCKTSKESLKLKDWLSKIKRTDPEHYEMILRYHSSLNNTISLILKRNNSDSK
ncbi:MAG: hypothetical protein ABSA11_13835 [Candidatus Bathyarchaeia archaeon]|jgi:hypothetical protein